MKPANEKFLRYLLFCDLYDVRRYVFTYMEIDIDCCSVAQSCTTLCDPMVCSKPGFLVLHHLQRLLKFMSVESVMPSNYFILCHPLLLLPSIFPSIRVFSNELALCIRWPKYWSFSFSISPSNEYSGNIHLPRESYCVPDTEHRVSVASYSQTDFLLEERKRMGT